MSVFLKLFNTTAEYNAYTADTSTFIKPNVSLCKDSPITVHYNPSVKVSGVALDRNTLALSEGATSTLVASVLPSNADNKNVTWSSSDDSIATVDNNGAVSGVAVGNAIITVTTEDGGFTDSCSLSVKSNKVITYTATAKLPETTTDESEGLHTKSLIGTSGNKLTMLSHTFENGVGSVTFNNDIGRFDSYAFWGCSGLTSIDIPNSVTSIGYRAFYNCSGLTSIDIPDNVTGIGDMAFYKCSGLTSCTIGSGVTSIGYNAFFNCTSLTSVNIPNNIASIGNAAFYGCSGLTSVDIPNNITSIGGNVFFGCSGLTSVIIEATTPPTLANVNAFANTNNCPIYVPSGSVNIYKETENWSEYASRIQAIP